MCIRDRSILEPYHRPKYVLYTDCIPQAGNGKMNRAGCRDLAERLLSQFESECYTCLLYTSFPVDDDTEEDRELALSIQGQESFLTSSTEEYAACFHTFINALRDDTFDKLVLSRHLTMDKVADFSPMSIFRAACKRYIHSYIYLCYTPQTGIWLGSTPEIILSGEKDEWHTVCLLYTSRCV